MQLKRRSVEAWQNEKHYSEDNNTSVQPYRSFLKIFIRRGKMHDVELNSGTSKSSK